MYGGEWSREGEKHILLDLSWHGGLPHGEKMGFTKRLRKPKVFWKTQLEQKQKEKRKGMLF